MAEFSEVMRQAKRMCNYIDNCDECPLEYVCNAEEFSVFTQPHMSASKMEKLVMDWAAQNPEPRYPTWQEWWQTTFPELVDRHISVNPCAFGVRSKGCNTTGSCHICRTQHIPADIAEKLGVKPIGGRDDG